MKEITQKKFRQYDHIRLSKMATLSCVDLSNVVIQMSLSSFPHVPISNVHLFYVQDKC